MEPSHLHPNRVFLSMVCRRSGSRRPLSVLALTAVALLAAANCPSAAAKEPQNPLNARRAFHYLEQICAIGPRISGSPGMERQREALVEQFEALGGKVTLQEFVVDHPQGGGKVPMANMIVQWHPERRERVLICAHYDTRPLPDQDRLLVNRRKGTFLGANDGASGTAVLLELAHLVPKLDGPIGVDFVLFDGEEFVYVERRDDYFLGSTHFAKQYAENPPDHKYRWGVLLDMVGDADLQIYVDQYSARTRDVQPLLAQIWGTAQQLGVNEFVARAKHEIRDDHLPLNQIAGIPTCDIIDFDYPAWHTTADTPERCSGESLAKVGWVVYEWLKSQTSQESRVESRGPE